MATIKLTEDRIATLDAIGLSWSLGKKRRSDNSLSDLGGGRKKYANDRMAIVKI